ncbi:hypothetical protein EIP86_005490 [Pleurotus ostreatoroseus]|nr:hypothetical protein EIP86_005490 [Pleurotus ostreatoroseus]
MAKGKKIQKSQPTEAVSLILPSLYLGPCSAASNKAFLTSNAITHVLSVGSTPSEKIEGVTYHRLSLNDSPSSSISKVSDDACKIIDDALASKAKGGGTGKILVHCSAGISRSPTLVIAYLMRSHRMSLKAAMGLVVKARPQVSPNPGFIKQLQVLEEEIFGLVTLDIDQLPKREKDRLALFEDDASSSVDVPQDE